MKSINVFISNRKSIKINFAFILMLGFGMVSCSDAKTNNSTNKEVEQKKTIKEIYKAKIAEFDKNEYESIEHYKKISLESNSVFIRELSNNVIPKWEKNISILKELISLDSLSPKQLEESKVGLKYSELRLEAFLLIKKANVEDTNKYNEELKALSLKIDEQLDLIN